MKYGKQTLLTALLYALFPASQVFLLFSRFFSVNDSPANDALTSVMLVALCLAADAAIALSLRSVRRSAALRAEKEALDKQIRLQEEYCLSLAEHFAHLRTLRHDLSNHLLTVKILAEEGRFSEAEAYMEQMRAQNAALFASAREGGENK